MPKYSTLLQKNLRAKTGEKVVRGHTLRFKNVFRSTGRKPQQYPQVGNVISFFTGEESPNGPVTSVERREKALKDARASQRANAGILTDKELRAKQLLKIKKKQEEAKQVAAERGIMIKMLRTTSNDKRNPYYVPGYDPKKEATYIENDSEKGRKPLDDKISTEDLWGLIRKYVSKDDHIKRNFITEEAERVVKNAEFENGPYDLEAYYSGIDLSHPGNDGDRIINRPAVERTSIEPFTGVQREEEPSMGQQDADRRARVERKTKNGTHTIGLLKNKKPRRKRPENKPSNQEEREADPIYKSLRKVDPRNYYQYDPLDLDYFRSLLHDESQDQTLSDERRTIANRKLEDVNIAFTKQRNELQNQLQDAQDPELRSKLDDSLAELNEIINRRGHDENSGHGVIGGRLIPKISPHRVLRLFEMRRPLTFLPREETATEEVENELNELKQRQQLYSERMKTLRGKTPPKGMVERAYPSKVVPFEYTPINGLSPYAFAPNLKKQRISLFNI